MEQLRHRLTNVSPKGQTCRADQNPLKRSDLDDFVNCYFGGKDGSQSRGYRGNRHERKESERFKSFTYEELTKRDP
jgi:type I restriction enzyme M protein